MKKCRAVPNREVASACIISGEQNQPLRTILELEEIKSYEIRAETLKQRTTVFNLTSRQAGKFGNLAAASGKDKSGMRVPLTGRAFSLSLFRIQVTEKQAADLENAKGEIAC